MRDKILKNWGLKLLSLGVALLLWFVVAQADDPIDTVYFSNIPVKLLNTELLEMGNKVYEVLDNSDVVRVSVRAPRTMTGQMRASDIIAEADLSKLTENNTVEITYDILNVNEDAVTINGNRDSVVLRIEDRVSRWIRVNYTLVGEVAEDYIVSSINQDQTMIEITGPKSAVEQVGYANVEFDVSGATRDMSANVETRLFAGDGTLIENRSISKNVGYVRMSVEVLATKEVPVRWSVTGTPAVGYLATGEVKYEPEKVRIAGTPAVLAGIHDIVIPESELDITGADETVEVMVNVKSYLPENTRLAESGYSGKLTASAIIEPRVSKTLEIPAQNISAVNIPDGFGADVLGDPASYRLDVSGLAATVDSLRQNSIVGKVDIRAWMNDQGMRELKPGIHSIPASYMILDGITVTYSENINVVITQNAE